MDAGPDGISNNLLSFSVAAMAIVSADTTGIFITATIWPSRTGPSNIKSAFCIAAESDSDDAAAVPGAKHGNFTPHFRAKMSFWLAVMCEVFTLKLQIPEYEAGAVHKPGFIGTSIQSVGHFGSNPGRSQLCISN